MRFNLSEITEIIKNRRSVKPEEFSNRKIHKEQIELMLDNARWAPTHGLTQPWRFTVFMNQGIDKLAEFQSELYKETTPEKKFNASKFEKLKQQPNSATAIIGIGMQRQEIGKIPEIEEVCATACAVQNLQLTATAYGISSYWSSGGITYFEETKNFVGLSKKDTFLGFLYLGYPKNSENRGQRRPIEYFTNWVD